MLQPDGKIVISGKPQGDQPGFDHTDVARFNPDGSYDPTFGTGGRLKLAALDVGAGLALQPDGKLVLVGTRMQPNAPVFSRFVLMRLNADGTPDASFGTGGQVEAALSKNVRAGGVAVQADGRIVVVGTSVFESAGDFVVARYDSSGEVDTGFGIGGTLGIEFFNGSNVGENVLVMPDGRIVVGGMAVSSRGIRGYGVARVLP